MSNNLQKRNNSRINKKRAQTEPKGKLRNLASYLQHIREMERKCIAREIHDEIGQELAVLNMEISFLEKKIPANFTSEHKRIKSISERIDKTINIVQKIITELRPALIDKHTLRSAIDWYLEEFKKNTGIKCDVIIDDELVTLDKEKEIYIFRIVQEILSNIIRHAEATRITFSLKKYNDKLVLSIVDNGKGIDEKQIYNPKSFGIIGMKERVSFLQGMFSIKGIQNEGTSVSISIPIDRNRTLTNTVPVIDKMIFLKNNKKVKHNW